MESKSRFADQSIFDLAFGLASEKYTDAEKIEVLAIIKKRTSVKLDNSEKKFSPETSKGKPDRKPLPGSKAAKIVALIEKGKTAREIKETLESKGVKVYPAEIYRLIKMYR